MRTCILSLACLSITVSAFSQNLSVYYPFNGNANDESGNAINPTYIGAGVTLTADRFGNANKAYYFDGTSGPNYSTTGSYMRMPANSLPANNRTISLWFYTNNVSNMPGLLGYGGNGSCGTTLLMGLNCTGSGQYWVQGHCGANPASFTYSTAPINNWYHWVLTIKGSSQKIYINGELKSTANTFSGSTATAGVDFALGSVTHTNGLSPYTDANVGFFQGKLDDVRIYDDAMTDAQVQNLYANEAMVAYFPFNGNAVDETGNGYNSTYTGTGVTLTTDRFGNANKAYYFDGAVGSYIRVPADNFPTTDRTISFWFNADQLGYYIPTPFSYGGNGCYNSLLMIINHYNHPNSYLVESHCAANVITAPYSSEPVNNWYHLTLTISGSTQKIFVNGVLQQSSNSFTSPTYVTGTSALLGACINTDGNSLFAGNFLGKLDEFRIYNSAMTDAQVLALHIDEAGASAVAFYPFNGNANDESGNGNNGTVIGASLTSDRFNNSNMAYSFNGTSDYINVPDAASIRPGSEISLSAWVKRTRFGIDIITEKGGDWTEGTCNYGMGVHNINNNMFYFFFNGGWRGTNGVSDLNWHHYVVVAKNGDANPALYIDGQPKPVMYTSGVGTILMNNSAHDLHIGSQVGGATYYGANVIDELSIYKRQLSAGEVQKMYNKSATDMVAYYPFNGNANDESGNNNNGVVTGASLTSDRFGNSNKAYNFNGANNFISVADNPDLFSDELTLSWWYKVPEYSGTRVVIGWVDGGNRYQQFFSGNSLAYFNGYCGGGACGGFNPTYNMTAVNQWQHVAVTYKKINVNASVTRLYINGELRQTDNHATAITYQPGATFFIGKTHDGGYFNGELDDIRVYKRLLSPNEILQLADVPVMPDLQVYLPMNGNANDMSGNNRNGTPYGGAVLTTDKYGNNNAAYSFDGAASGITLANTTSLDFIGSKFALSAWVKFSNNISNSMVVGKHDCGTPNGYILSVQNNNVVFWLSYGNSWNNILTTETYNDGRWHHLTGSFDGLVMYLYVDGVLKESSPAVYNNPASGAAIKIGDPTGNCGSGIFNGSIDEVKIYGNSLDAAQVMALYKQSRGSGNALKFDGVDDIVSIPNGGALNDLQTGTIDLWVKWNGINQDPSTNDAYGAIVARQSNAQFSNQIIALNGADPNSAKIIWKPYSSTSTSITSSLSPGNKWNHLAIVYSSGIHEMYLNGILVGSSSDAGAIANGAVPLTLGGWIDHGNCFGNADLDEVRIWNVALSQTQIRQWMNRKITAEHPAYSNLAGYYTFDEQHLILTYDSKGAKTGTMVNGPALVISGAAIGDGSAYDFINPTRSATLTLSTGENFRATASSGNPAGISVYVVKDPPLSLTGTLGVGLNDHYYGVHLSAGNNPQYTAVYDYTGNTSVTQTIEPDLLLFSRADNSQSSWVNSNATLDVSANTLTVTGQSTEYILGSSGLPLPVTLLDLKARKINTTTALLSWQTATESNNHGFEVQRSFDGSNFSMVKFVNGAGNSNHTIDYSVKDVPGRTGRIYYRLNQVDLDGRNTFSNTVSLLFDKEAIIKIYPNPAQQQVMAEGITDFSRVQVVDGTGRLLKDIVNNGQYQVTINLSGLVNGFYFIRLVSEKETRTIKLAISN